MMGLIEGRADGSEVANLAADVIRLLGAGQSSGDESPTFRYVPK